jgi:membrane protease YdiL (CAAX protease family)
MDNLIPYLHILFAVIAYFAFAISASLIAQKAGINLKEMGSRTSPRLLLIGAAANLGALIAVLLFVRLLDGKPISVLGLSVQPKDLAFSILTAAGSFLLAILFVALLKQSKHFQVITHRPAQGFHSAMNLVAGLLVLLLVAVQEEVLYRGYVFLNLAKNNPLVILSVSTLIFVLIHFMTNRVNLHQVLSWLLSGLILGAVYLMSGSIWVPIIIHFTIDATNVLVFNITGQYSIFTISPSLTERDRTAYRITCEFAILVTLLVVYGPAFRLS